MVDYLTTLYIAGGTSLLASIILSLANNKLGKESLPVLDKVSDILPNLDCGACGFPDCRSFADEIAANPGLLKKCNNIDSNTFETISKFINKNKKETQGVAVIYCNGGKNCQDKYLYKGIETCLAANNVFRGAKSCIFGCIALGDCARICPAGAITHSAGEVPVIDKEKCTECGLCAATCPKKVISLIPRKYDIHIRCSSVEKGRSTREICGKGCIACGICVKICPKKAITIKDNLAKIDYSNCIVCGLCVERCPANTIERIIKKTTTTLGG